MMKSNFSYSVKVCAMFALCIVTLAACKKDEYYIDGGLSKANFNGNMLQYLQAKPVYFDTLATVIKLAGLEEGFEKDEMTFFAPTDYSIRRAMVTTNLLLYQAGKDTLMTLKEVSPDIWRKYLMRYMFKGANKLNDYPQLDVRILSLYPGQNYYSYNNTVMNIGTIFDDVNGIKYGGYRHLAISYLQDLSKPQNYATWIRADISSSDIKPTNGVVHTLNVFHVFGFNNDFARDVFATK